MVICKECQTENIEGARRCQNPKCGKRLPISVPVPPVEPVTPSIVPKDLRLTDLVSRDLLEQVAAVLKKHNVADMLVPNVISTLTDRATALAGDAALHDLTPINAQLSQVLGREVRPNESALVIVEALIGKLKSVPVAPVADPVTPSIPIGLRDNAAAVLQQPNLEGKSAADLISMLTDHAKALKDQVAHHDVTPPDQVKFPAVASKLLHYLPVKSRWIATLVAPLLIGGGTGFFTPKDQTELVETKTKLVATAEQLNKTKINLDTQTTQVDTLKDEIRRLERSLGSDASALNIQVHDLQGQVKFHQQRGEAANAKANQLGAFARYGFLEWRHVGGGPLSFSPTGQPSRGRVTEGIFPSGNCEIVDVISSDLEKPQLLKGSNCFGPSTFKIKGSPRDTNDKRVLIVWRQVSGR